MGKLLRIAMTDGSTIEIDRAVWSEEARSGISGSLLGNQRLIVVQDASGRRLAYLEVKMGNKTHAKGEFVDGDIEQTLRHVVRGGLAFPSVIDLVERCLEQLHQKT
jgi:hypothetical protein